ncbi:DNA-processing protein DprA [Leucobacter insecticola]|uniref:DNA-processing protein DprA n=1 Tax=Leucobacter insecticola TaxID=2714934 RepID=UPI001FCB6FF6|nr:DNA-processing protein DprA [Leucobacter insecticola]
MSRGLVQVRADRTFRDLLSQLVPAAPGSGAANPEPLSQVTADALLARVVWSCLVEPGDAVAGAVIAALGAGPSLDLLASAKATAQLGAAMRKGGHEEVSDRRIAAGVKRWLPRLDRAAVLHALTAAVNCGAHLVTPDSSRWPAGLNDLGIHTPLLLWVRGDPSLLDAFSLAVVGARACTGYGTDVTAEFTGEACTTGATIVSGAAYGIDAVAHRTALALETPTIAVLAGGVDRPYPRAHSSLLDRIVNAGAVCSEMAPGSAPTRWRFLQRNRVIAALTRATLVTEAGPKSGSLNTAGHAAEIGRPLGAVPGPVTSAASLGCHRLIRDYGAALVSRGSDVRELLGSQQMR